MKPYYQDSAVTQYCGHALKVLASLPAEIAQACVTSPPYWGLRKYAGEQEFIWGDNPCAHEWETRKISLLHENRNFHSGTQEAVLNSGYELAHTHKTSELKAAIQGKEIDAWGMCKA